MKVISIVLAMLLFAGCAPVAVKLPESAIIQNLSSNEPLIDRIVTLDENIRGVRAMLPLLAMFGQLTEELYHEKVKGPLLSADYYMSKAWTALVEGESEVSLNYVNFGEESLEQVVKALQPPEKASSDAKVPGTSL